MKEIIAALFLIISLCENNINTNESTGYIFLGDSRTAGMDMAVDIESDSKFVVAKVGQGYKWMIDTGLSEVYEIVSENTNYNNWVLITNLGVNDLHNSQKYADAYKELSDIFEIYFVSVNPCEGKYESLNSEIDSFNSAMKELDYITYVDTNTMLCNGGFGTTDGLHYDNETYNEIYDIIVGEVIGSDN